MIIGGKKEMEQKGEISESKEGGRLKDKLSKIGKTLKKILPMKETIAAAGIAVMSQALPSCTTRFDAPPYNDGAEDVRPDSAPDMSSEADAPIDMEPDSDAVEDVNEDGREPCPLLPEGDRTVTDIELLQGESITVNSITVTAVTIDVDSLEVRYTFACSGIPLEGGLTITGESILRTKTYSDDRVHIIITQQDVMSNSVLFDITVRQT